MRAVVSDGTGYVLNPAIASDPRLSASQRTAILNAGLVDSNARVDGLDGRMRPVIVATLEGPGRTAYALLRNGDPARPAFPLIERWNGRTRRST